MRGEGYDAEAISRLLCDADEDCDGLSGNGCDGYERSCCCDISGSRQRPAFR